MSSQRNTYKSATKDALRRCGTMFLALLLVCSILIVPVSAANLSQSSIYATGAYVMDVTTGEELWSKNPDTTLVPASTTKIMATYLVFEALGNGQITKDTVVPISQEVASFSVNSTWANVPLTTTGTYTVDELLHGVILTSACAAIQALGELVAETEENFVALMNAKAQEMGIACSFVDSYGGSAKNCVTARGLAYLSYRLITDYPDYLNYSQKRSYVFHGKTYTTTNRFISGDYSCNGVVDGIKTGSTTAAGACLVATAYQDDLRVLAVVLKSPYDSYRYTDGKKLLNYGFAVLKERLDAGYQYAYPTSLAITVEETVTAYAYNIDGQLYVRPQDMGAILDGTAGSFALTSDAGGDLKISTANLYNLSGSEFSQIDATPVMAAPGGNTVFVDGWATGISTYLIGDICYVSLAELMAELNLSMDLSENTAVIHVPDFVEPFIDVLQSAWYSDAVSYVYAKDIMHGTGDVTFQPEVTLNRAMMAQILYNLYNLYNLKDQPTLEDDGVDSFVDVASGTWYYDAVEWAAETEVILGRGEGIFDPLADISRQEMVTMIYRYECYINGDITARNDLSGFTDRDAVAEYALEAMQWAVAEDIIHGMGGNTLQPKGTALRAQVAQVMANAGY